MFVQRRKKRKGLQANRLNNIVYKDFTVNTGCNLTVDSTVNNVINLSASFKTPQHIKAGLKLSKTKSKKAKLEAGSRQDSSLTPKSLHPSSASALCGLTHITDLNHRESCGSYRCVIRTGVKVTTDLKVNKAIPRIVEDKKQKVSKDTSSVLYYIVSPFEINNEFIQLKTQVNKGILLQVEVPNSAWLSKQSWLSDVKVFTNPKELNKYLNDTSSDNIIE